MALRCRNTFQHQMFVRRRRHVWRPSNVHCIPWVDQLPSGYVNSLLLKMTIEIVDFPINSMVIFNSYVKLPEGTSVFFSLVYYSPTIPVESAPAFKSCGFLIPKLDALPVTCFLRVAQSPTSSSRPWSFHPLYIHTHTYIYIYIYLFPVCCSSKHGYDNAPFTCIYGFLSYWKPTEIPWKCWKLSDWHPVSCLKRLQCLSLQLSSGEMSENEVGRPLNEVVWAGKWWGKPESQPGNIMWQIFALKATWWHETRPIASCGSQHLDFWISMWVARSWGHPLLLVCHESISQHGFFKWPSLILKTFHPRGNSKFNLYIFI